ncbi:3'-5' exonuclease [Pseudomonas aeruginosa]|uniref:3'-5' exonuclease n=1 Tax=Pseudomonas aeruginosa TaxID=287 RepID=UPI000E3117B1|nr:3'-5' exonuclease [Pseudomonas aeruginosa]NPZ19493.1 3'-5' exonuclease [Pseudomonas aeruginosa]
MKYKTLANTEALSDLELFELIVAAYPEKFAEREEAGEDIWDEVQEFIENELIADELATEFGLRQFLARIVMLSHPVQSPFSGEYRHALGQLDIRGDHVQMTAAAHRMMHSPTPVELAREWMDTDEAVAILDTETTGLGDFAEIVEIAVIDRDGKTLLQSLVKPTRPIPAEISEIHKITDAMVADAPSWPEVQTQLAQVLSGRRLVIWHADYDLRLIGQSAAAHGIVPPHFTAECAQTAYKRFYGEPDAQPGKVRRQRLAYAAAQQGVVIDGQAHRAEVDCRTTLGVIAAMASGKGATWEQTEAVTQ